MSLNIYSSIPYSFKLLRLHKIGAYLHRVKNALGQWYVKYLYWKLWLWCCVCLLTQYIVCICILHIHYCIPHLIKKTFSPTAKQHLSLQWLPHIGYKTITVRWLACSSHLPSKHRWQHTTFVDISAELFSCHCHNRPHTVLCNHPFIIPSYSREGSLSDGKACYTPHRLPGSETANTQGTQSHSSLQRILSTSPDKRVLRLWEKIHTNTGEQNMQAPEGSVLDSREPQEWSHQLLAVRLRCHPLGPQVAATECKAINN